MNFTVTLEDLHELTDKMVAVNTMRNRGNLPRPVGKRGKKHVWRYSDMLTWWQDKNFEASLPDEATARERLGVNS